MRQSTRDIILRAKQQPRHGTGPLNSIDAALTQLVDSVSLYTGATNQAINVAGKLTDSFDKVTTAAQTNVNQMLWLEKRNQSLQKAFMMTRKDAAAFGQTIDKVSKDLKFGGQTMRAYVENLKGVAKGFAGSEKFIASGFGKQLTQIQDDLIRTMGLSKETANEYTKMMVGRGGNLEEELKKQVAIAEAIKQQTGYQDAQKEILEGMAGLSADIEAHYNRIPGSLELGILKAKQLGLSVEDMYNAGAKMLSVEETINKELELQALTGQRLVDQDGASLINKYQQAQLNGDLNAQADIMREIMTEMGDTIKTNPYARQALSDLTGLTAAQLVTATREMALASNIEGAQQINNSTTAGVMAASANYQGTLDEQRAGTLQTTEGLEENLRDKKETELILDKIPDYVVASENATNSIIEYMKGLNQNFETFFAGVGTIGEILLPAGLAQSLAGDIGAAFTTAVSTAKYELSSISADKVLINATSIPTTTTAPARLAEGGVVPSGYPNDTYPALLTSGETVTPAGKLPTADMSQFAAAIVNAIRQQTTALTSNSPMNPPLWT